MGKVRFNDNTEIVAAVKEGLKRKDGYCPCRLEKIPENKCICKEFRDQINGQRDDLAPYLCRPFYRIEGQRPIIGPPTK